MFKVNNKDTRTGQVFLLLTLAGICWLGRKGLSQFTKVKKGSSHL